MSFVVGDSVVSLVAVDAVPAGLAGVVVDLDSPFFSDSVWVDFGDVVAECDPDWLRHSPPPSE